MHPLRGASRPVGEHHNFIDVSAGLDPRLGPGPRRRDRNVQADDSRDGRSWPVDWPELLASTLGVIDDELAAKR